MLSGSQVYRNAVTGWLFIDVPPYTLHSNI